MLLFPALLLPLIIRVWCYNVKTAAATEAAAAAVPAAATSVLILC